MVSTSQYMVGDQMHLVLNKIKNPTFPNLSQAYRVLLNFWFRLCRHLTAWCVPRSTTCKCQVAVTLTWHVSFPAWEHIFQINATCLSWPCDVSGARGGGRGMLVHGGCTWGARATTLTPVVMKQSWITDLSKFNTIYQLSFQKKIKINKSTTWAHPSIRT